LSLKKKTRQTDGVDLNFKNDYYLIPVPPELQSALFLVKDTI